jgi:hypothetical protein
LIDWIPQSAVALYIYRMGRSCPARKSFYKPKSIRTPRFGLDTGAPVRHTGQTGVLDMQILYKPYLPHPDSDLDIPHMNLDLLDETYLMVKSKLYFVVFDHTGLTGQTRRANFGCEHMPPCFLVKLACQKTFTKIKIG